MRVLIVDDSIIAREGLRRLLEAEGHRVVDAVGRPDQAPGRVATEHPDAVIMDIRMPPTFTDEGVALALALRRTTPALPVLVLSQYAVPEYATRLLEGGADGIGYLLKDRILEPMQLSHALHRLGAGGTVVDPDVVGELILARRAGDVLSRLSARELEVLRLMAEGLSDKGIAERMWVSTNTVGTHVQHIFQKLELPGTPASNRRVLAVLALLQRR
ncbi:response regulator transcription factor [Actinoplanes aureus]|jgi:DNA-binding NarL/FixJ family response regulator|uniref:Response regulator transcription factor n=1 Tax=Actinoplanes aureus TaxID=2792083 RepID=A0A931C880_9ACTN|nr:response regulator transcription factor [Actinoplanes aureus]MBG0561288.1 response regulator transcription factor [Actinoplanes aureus]